MELKELSEHIQEFLHEGDNHYGISLASDGENVSLDSAGHTGQFVAMFVAAMDRMPNLHKIFVMALRAYEMKHSNNKNQS